MSMTEKEMQAAIADYMVLKACRHDPSSRHLMLGTVGRVALSVAVPMKGMQREMVFVKSGLALGLISPVNNPVERIKEGATLTLGGENHGVGTSADSDLATAQLR